jgi:hypothetical protein
MIEIIGKDDYLLTKKLQYKHSVYFLLIFLLISLILMWVLIVVYKFDPIVSYFSSGIVYGLFYILKSPIEKFIHKAWQYRRGLDGEKYVGELLKTLNLPTSVFYNVKLPENPYNIDYVVIATTGIFTIEVKHHSGEITFENEVLCINGLPPKEKNFLNQAYAEAKKLEEYLHTKLESINKVQPVLVFSNRNAQMHFGMHQQRGVYIIRAPWVTKLVTENKPVLNNVQIDQICNVMKAI